MYAVAAMCLLILFAFSLLTEFIGYGLARLLLPLLSFGRIVVQPFTSTEMIGFSLLGYRRDSEGCVEISKDAIGFTSSYISLFLLVISAVLIHAFS